MATFCFVGMDGCNEEKYYIFYHSNSTPNYGLKYVVIQINKATGGCSLAQSESYAFSDNISNIGTSAPYGAIAVGTENNNRRFLYYIVGNNYLGAIRKFTISKSGISSPSVIYNSSSVLYNATEFDLSPDGGKLAWGASHSDINHQYNYVLYLGASGEFNGVIKSFLFSTTLTSHADAIKGVEFSDDGNLLFFGFPNPDVEKGIYVINLINNLRQKITNSENYGFSNIERGANGRFYVGEISSTSSWLNSFSQISPYSFATPLSIPLQRYFLNAINLPNKNFAFLPDQIDGEDYDVILNKISPISFDIASNVSISGIQFWNGNTNPYSKSNINVSSLISVNFGGALVIKDMTMSFGSVGHIDVNGGLLFINSSTLKSIDCSLMWPGITVRNGGLVVFGSDFNTNPNNSVVKDAIVAVNSVGSTNKIDINHVNFIANENDVYLFNSAPSNLATESELTPNTLVRNSTFDHTSLLKDQTKGLEYYSLNSGKKGITGIYLSNCTGLINIGPSNNFVRGRYGIYSEKSPIIISGGNNFTNISGSLSSNFPSTAIKIIGYNSQVSKVENLNTIYKCQRGIYTSGKIDLKIENNNFSNTYETAISVTKNKGGTVKISNNYFDFCNWEAINLFDNGYSSVAPQERTSVEIDGNTIKNHSFATGIIAQEISSEIKYNPFKKFKINNNNIGESPNRNIGQGVIIRNILGSEQPNGRLSSKLDNGAIFNNTIFYTTITNQNANGIYIENSKKIGVYQNNIYGDNKMSNLNSGIVAYNTSPCSINFNELNNCGNGVKVGNNNINSNYFCNSFYNNRVGINLRDGHVLRNTGSNHGICLTEARVNYFYTTINSDINRTTNVDPLRNKWVFEAGPLPRFTREVNGGYYTSNSIFACTGDQNCSFPFTSGIISFPEIDNNQPEAYNWNQQMKYIHDSKFSNMPIDLESNFNKLIEINDHIVNEKYDSALLLLNSFTPLNQIESEYKVLFEIIGNVNYPLQRPYTDFEISTIREIANYSSYFSGPQVSTARAILKNITGEDVYDFEPIIEDIIGNVNSSCTPIELNDKELFLVDEYNAIIPDVKCFLQLVEGDYKFYFFGEQLSALNPEKLISVYCNDENFVQPNFKSLSSWLHSISLENSIDLTCTGNSKVQVDLNLEVFPNPSNGKIKIKGNVNPIDYYLYSMDGVKISEGNTLGNEINISNFTNGVYLLHLLSSETKEVLKSEKIIIVHN